MVIRTGQTQDGKWWAETNIVGGVYRKGGYSTKGRAIAALKKDTYILPRGQNEASNR